MLGREKPIFIAHPLGSDRGYLTTDRPQSQMGNGGALALGYRTGPLWGIV
jgi:hypothetical protein